MTRISLREFAALADRDEALRRQLTACSEAGELSALMERLAAERGYRLETAAPVGKQALPDELLDEVAGGRTLDLLDMDEELNSYSWFVTLLQRILGRIDRP